MRLKLGIMGNTSPIALQGILECCSMHGYFNMRKILSHWFWILLTVTQKRSLLDLCLCYAFYIHVQHFTIS